MSSARLLKLVDPSFRLTMVPLNTWDELSGTLDSLYEINGARNSVNSKSKNV